ncbi:MAG: L,D-transpeptidase [Conexibacter sp.]
MLRPTLVTTLLLALAVGACGNVEETVAPALAPEQTDAADAAAADASGQLTVHITHPIPLRTRPGGRVVARLARKTAFDSATVLPVVRRRGPWYAVISDALPNNRIGWISVHAGVETYRTPYRIVVSLRRRELVARRDGRIVQRFPVAIGGPSTPTPTGRFAVTDKLLTGDAASPYGCCILALSAHQPHTPQGWGGGDRVAIHATNLPETIGTAASLGCLRGSEEAVRRIVQTVPLGTVVTIKA